MLDVRRRRHIVLPVDQLVPLPIVWEQQEVVVGELHALRRTGAGGPHVITPMAAGHALIVASSGQKHAIAFEPELACQSIVFDRRCRSNCNLGEVSTWQNLMAQFGWTGTLRRAPRTERFGNRDQRCGVPPGSAKIRASSISSPGRRGVVSASPLSPVELDSTIEPIALSTVDANRIDFRINHPVFRQVPFVETSFDRLVAFPRARRGDFDD